MTTTQTALFSDIESVLKSVQPEAIADARKAVLDPLARFIQTKVSENKDVRINFICTHNSRRSHLSQVWAQTLASYFGVKNVFCYSGGTEATAVFPMVIKTLKNTGFEIQQLSENNNPVYSIKFAGNAHSVVAFSKTMDDEFNPTSEFAAIMTCDSANEACPFVPGAETRIPIMFEDPKVFDNTPQQAEKYQERSLQIATEMYYIFSQIEV